MLAILALVLSRLPTTCDFLDVYVSYYWEFQQGEPERVARCSALFQFDTPAGATEAVKELTIVRSKMVSSLSRIISVMEICVRTLQNGTAEDIFKKDSEIFPDYINPLAAYF